MQSLVTRFRWSPNCVHHGRVTPVSSMVSLVDKDTITQPMYCLPCDCRKAHSGSPSVLSTWLKPIVAVPYYMHITRKSPAENCQNVSLFFNSVRLSSFPTSLFLFLLCWFICDPLVFLRPKKNRKKSLSPATRPSPPTCLPSRSKTCSTEHRKRACTAP